MNNDHTIGDQTSAQLFLQSSDRWANKIRWQVPTENGWKSISWDTYLKKVSSITAYLHQAGYSYPDKIGILAPNSLEWIYTAMGVMISTAILVPIYSGNTIDQSMYMINHSDMQVLILESSKQLQTLMTVGLESSDVRLVIMLNDERVSLDTSITIKWYEEISSAGGEIMEKRPGLIEELALRPLMDNIAYMVYTSGTTGTPKGVPLSHGNLAVSTQDWISVNGHLIPEDVIDIHWLPNAHIYGWGSIGLGNLFGFESYLASPVNVLDLLPTLKPNILLSVPAYYEKLYLKAQDSSTDPKIQLENLKDLTGGNLGFMLSGGAGLKTEIKEFFLESGMWITEGYGLSECSPTLTMNQRHDYRFDSVGKPFPSVQIRLAPDGEIQAKGGNVFCGYYKDPEATKACFTDDGWFQTGDIGTWLTGGFLKIIDRKDDIIITSGGKNIAPQWIEKMFGDHPQIEHVLVYGNAMKYVVAL
ncbi:MAG: AMP-binding protein, partial [Candidatus Marinimicrobia bacterium]|nr:AMP-binding protein [Candidatus Neomarinimicrobiota bacterium]